MKKSGGAGFAAGGLGFAARTKSPLPGYWGEGGWRSNAFLVVVVNFGGCRVVELARRANRLLPRVGPGKPGRQVPVQVVDGVRVFGVGLGQFAGEDLRLFLEPSRS